MKMNARRVLALVAVVAALAWLVMLSPAEGQVSGTCSAGKTCTVSGVQLQPALNLATYTTTCYGGSDGGVPYTCTAWDGGFREQCYSGKRGLTRWFAGSALIADGGGVALDGGRYLCPQVINSAVLSGWVFDNGSGGGTTIIDGGVSWPLLAPSGSLGAPSYSWAAALGDAGWYYLTTPRVGLTVAGSRQFEVGTSSTLYGYTDNFYLNLGSGNTCSLNTNGTVTTWSVVGADVKQAVGSNASLSMGETTGFQLKYGAELLQAGGAGIKATTPNGLQLTGVANASLVSPTTARAGLMQWTTDTQRLKVTDGGAWYTVAWVEDARASWHGFNETVTFTTVTLVPFYTPIGRDEQTTGLDCTLGTAGSTGAQSIAATIIKVSDASAVCTCPHVIACNGDDGGTGLTGFGRCACAATLSAGVPYSVSVSAAACDTKPTSVYCNVH